MTTRKPTKTKPPAAEPDITIDVGEIGRAAEASFADADADRIATLDTLADLRTARSYMLQRKRNALTAAHAHADEVDEIDRALADVTATVSSYKAQAELAATPTPVAKPDETVVHGVVRGAGAGVKVTLADDTGPIKGATTTTDAAGNFVIRFAPGEKPPRTLTLHVADEKKRAPIEVEPGAGAVRFVVVSHDD